jgi:hypothetical protein
MFILNNKKLPLDTAFTSNDIQYPANWLRLTTTEEKIAIGITEVPDPEPVDSRFYLINSDGTGTPKDLDTLKIEWIRKINQTTYDNLIRSDWMVIRKADTGNDIPTEWSTFRLAVRANNITNKALINGASDFEQFVSIATSLTWATPPESL